MMLLEMKESFASGRLPVDYVVNHKRGIEEDEKFSPLALEVKRPNRSITLDILPRDGSEFIHLSRLEEIYSLPPVFFTARQQKMYRYRLVAQLFEKKALHLKENKASLIKKFPLQFDLPGKKEEKKWCKLCLGSKLYNEIYDEPCNDEVEAYHPLVSIISHLEQHMVKSLLKYLYRWFLAINLHDSIACWIFSLLICLEHPVNEKCQNFIRVFQGAMINRLRACGKENSRESRQLSTIMAVLDLNFKD